MDPSILQWLWAFLATQLVEVPIYLGFSRSQPMGRRWLYAFGASTLTHPAMWFLAPWETHAYWLVWLTTEAVVVLAESFWGRVIGITRPVTAAVCANAASITFGMLLYAAGIL